MEKQNYKEKYPIFSKEYSKSKIDFKQLDDISKYFIKKIEIHEFAEYIGVFDHYMHTSSINTGLIHKDIIGAKNILFCFGKKLLDPKILSVRPRSIGICEIESRFIISFLEVPNPDLNITMIKWVNDLSKISETY